MTPERPSFGVPSVLVEAERTRRPGYVVTAPVAGALVTTTIRLVRPLARGGMGSVWLAEHLVLGAPVAVKFMSESTLCNREARDLFHQEAAALARIRSPHVVQVFDFGLTEGGLPFIVMELLEGETLQDRIERFGRLSARLTVEIVRQLGVALSRAHELGIVHRDIKPENVFLVETGTGAFVKLLDFGIASEVGAATDDVVGTPHFMSPEQMDGGAVGPAADVWALGVVAYYCLSGRLPFAGRNLSSLSVSARHGPTVPLASLLPEPAPALEQWIVGALEPDPFLRYPDARSALDALTCLLTGTELELEIAPRRRSADVILTTGDAEDLSTRAFRRWRVRRITSRVAGVLAVMAFAAFGTYAVYERPAEARTAVQPAVDLLSSLEHTAVRFFE